MTDQEWFASIVKTLYRLAEKPQTPPHIKRALERLAADIAADARFN